MYSLGRRGTRHHGARPKKAVFRQLARLGAAGQTRSRRARRPSLSRHCSGVTSLQLGVRMTCVCVTFPTRRKVTWEESQRAIEQACSAPAGARGQRWAAGAARRDCSAREQTAAEAGARGAFRLSAPQRLPPAGATRRVAGAHLPAGLTAKRPAHPSLLPAQHGLQSFKLPLAGCCLLSRATTDAAA
jgi:hypothetical protein